VEATKVAVGVAHWEGMVVVGVEKEEDLEIP
jgi:hypothetical protein